MFDNIRSSYGVKGRGWDKTYVPQVATYFRGPGTSGTAYRSLKHQPLGTATAALQYATRVRRRFVALCQLGGQPEALCVCGHPAEIHTAMDAYDAGCAEQVNGCHCDQFKWVWELPCGTLKEQETEATQ